MELKLFSKHSEFFIHVIRLKFKKSLLHYFCLAIAIVSEICSVTTYLHGYNKWSWYILRGVIIFRETRDLLFRYDILHQTRKYSLVWLTYSVWRQNWGITFGAKCEMWNKIGRRFYIRTQTSNVWELNFG